MLAWPEELNMSRPSSSLLAVMLLRDGTGLPLRNTVLEPFEKLSVGSILRWDSLPAYSPGTVVFMIESLLSSVP